MNSTPLTTETNLALTREYIDGVFNAHQPDLAAEYRTPDVKWHGGKLGTIEGPDNDLTTVLHDMGVYTAPWL